MKYYISILIVLLIISNNYSQSNNFMATYKVNYTMVNYDSILNSMKEKSKGFMEMVKKDNEAYEIKSVSIILVVFFLLLLLCFQFIYRSF